jgi:long-chain acyl-CoA synthetase
MPHYKALEILSKDLNLSGLQLRDLCEKHGVIEAIHKAIVEIGLRYKLNRKEIPTKIIITPEEWTPDNGMLTAALKLKRINITHKYKVEIEKMFS